MPKSFRCALLATLALAGGLFAQSFLGSIVGLVTDPAGAIVPGAKVVLAEVTKGSMRATTTNAEGQYAFPDLAPGTYLLTVTAPGFGQVKSSEITLLAAKTARFDAALSIGSTETSIRVSAAAPTLNTENAEIGDVRPHQDMVTLPMQRANLYYMFLTSGVVSGSGSSFMLGGLRGTYTHFSIDGVSGNNALYGGQSGSTMNDQSMESVRELKVMESNNSAEFPGVGGMMVSTRSGENQLHGSGFYMQDNARLDSTAFFSRNGAKGPALHWFGGSLGGPVYLPKIYNGRNKTFFFGTFERRVWPAAAGNMWSSGAIVPPAAFKQGDFSSVLSKYPIKDPLGGTPFANNAIPANRISPVSKFLQQYYPDPVNPGVGISQNNWNGSIPRPEIADRYDIRLDHSFGNSDTLSGRFTHQHDPMPVNSDTDFLAVNPLGSGPALGNAKVRNITNAFVSETHTFSPRVVSEFRLGFQRDMLSFTGYDDGSQVLQKAGLQGLGVAPGLTGFPQFDFNQSGLASLTEHVQQVQISNIWELMDNVTFQKGTHTIKSGILIRYAAPLNTNTDNNRFGRYTFTGFASGLDYADFLLGIPYQSQRVTNPPDRYSRYTNTGLFVTDAWNVTPRLTVNLGLRWEYFMPPVDNNDRRYAFDPATGGLVVPTEFARQTFVSSLYPAAIPISVGNAGFPGRSLMYGYWKNFSPRVSLAYRLSDRTVLRGGYGVYYAPLYGSLMDNFAGGPFGTLETFTNQLTNAGLLFQFPNPFGGSPRQMQPGNLSVTGTDPRLRFPQTQQWSFTMERQLGQSIVARATYRGFMTTRIPYVADLNIPQPGADSANNNWKMYPNFSTVRYTLDGGIQRMNALDLTIERHFAKGVTFQANYTLAKDRTDVGDDGESAAPENPYNRAREMADMRYVPRQRFVTNAIWDVPFGRGKQFGSSLPAAVNAVLGNWEIAIAGVMQTGQFLTPTYSGNQPNVRATSLRPDCTGDWSVSNPSRDGWFNPAAFTKPAAGSYGNCGRGIIVGPGLVNANLALHKYFKLTEKLKMKLEANAANAFNHMSLGTPTVNISSASAGKIGGAQGGTNALQPTVVSSNGERHVFAGIRFEF